MSFQHSPRCPNPHDECVCGANDAMLEWADQQNDRVVAQLEVNERDIVAQVGYE